MKNKLIRVINPNSNCAVTDSMSRALEPLRMTSNVVIDCTTIESGPWGIANDADIASAATLVRDLVASDKEADVFVNACYSDPGLKQAREHTNKPVLGIGECAVLTALGLGHRFGVISISDWSVSLHRQLLEELHLYERCAGDRPLGISVESVESAPDALEKIASVGARLRDEDGADVVITACAGMAKHRLSLEKILGIPVVDPVLAATTMALGVVRAQ